MHSPKKGMDSLYAWHYTTNDAYTKILETGQLKSRAALILERLQEDPSNRSMGDGESSLPDYMKHPTSFLRHKPIIWFSRNQHWEKQAGSMNESKGGKGASHWEPALTMRESYNRGHGLVRLGLSEDRLLNWEELMRAAGMPVGLRMTMQLLDTWAGHTYESQHVMGLIAPAIPLSDFDAVETFVPYGGKPPKENWLPFLGYWESLGLPDTVDDPAQCSPIEHYQLH